MPDAVIAGRERSTEINQWWRASRAETDRHRDGTTLDAQGLPPVTTFVAQILKPTSQQRTDASWLASTRQVHVWTDGAHGLLSVTDPGSTDARIQVGRASQRLHRGQRPKARPSNR